MWWFVAVYIGQSPLQFNGDPATNELKVFTGVTLGAYPGFKATAELDFMSRTTTVPSLSTRWSKTRLNDTDVLYLANTPIRVKTTDAQQITLGLDTLLAETDVWGVCDNALYLHKLPRHCRRGSTGVRRCSLEGCELHYLISHEGKCRGNELELQYGTYSTTVPCDRSLFLGEPHENVIESALPRLSIARANLQFEYNAAAGEVKVWEKVGVEDDVVQIVAMVFLAVALSSWLGWTRDLNALLAGKGDSTAAELWERLSHVAVAVGDCIWIAATMKVYQFFADAKIFMPETVDRLFGHEFAELYCLWYVGIVAIAAFATLYVLLLAMIGNNFKVPEVIACRLRAPAALCNAGPGQVCALITVRWLYESVLLTSLHVATPETIGENFQLAVGLAVGACVAGVAGRDCQSLLLMCRSRLSKLLSVASLAILLVHVSIFMIFPSIAGAYGNTENVAIVLATSVTIQVAVASALYHRKNEAPHCARDRRYGVKQTSPAVLF